MFKNKYLQLSIIFIVLVVIVSILNGIVVANKEEDLIISFNNKIELIESGNIPLDDLYFKHDIIKLVYKDKVIIENPSNYPIEFYFDKGYSSDEVNHYLYYFLFNKKVVDDYEIMYIQILDSNVTDEVFMCTSYILIFIIYLLICLIYYFFSNSSKKSSIKLNEALYLCDVSDDECYTEIEFNASFRKVANKFLSFNDDGLIILDRDKNIVFNNILTSEFITKDSFKKTINNEYINNILNDCYNDILIDEEFNYNDRIYNVTSIQTDVIKKKYYAIYLTDITDGVMYKKNQELFFNQASHELRTPLSIIQCLLEMFFDPTTTDEEREEMNESILEECRKLNILISSIIDISKRFKIDDLYTKVNLNKVLNDTLEKHKYSNLELKVDIDKNPTLICNESKMRIIFENIIKNAYLHNIEGGFINISIKQNFGLTELIVENSSVNISKEEVSKIFNPFYKCASNDETNIGSGLGMALTKIICDNYKYDIEFINENNISTVSIKFYSNNSNNFFK